MFPGLSLSREPRGPLVAVLPRRGTGVVAIQVWVNAGSAQDPPGKGGLAHFLEHMMFKGTKRRGPEAIARWVESRGGSLNAHTGRETTAYENVLPAADWSRMLAWEAERFSGPVWREADSERSVVLEERRMAVRASPRQRLVEATLARAYPGHPYGRPTLGTEREIASYAPGDLGGYFRRHYRAGRTTVVVAGDVAPSGVQRRVRDLWPTDSLGTSRPRLLAPPPPRPGPVSVRVADEASHLFIAWRLPPWSPKREALWDGLALALAWGEGSPLRERLVEAGACSSLSASSWLLRKGGLFLLSADLAAGVSAEDGSRVVGAALDGISEDELAARVPLVHARLQTAVLHQLDTAEGAADLLGQSLARGRPDAVASTLRWVGLLNGPALGRALSGLRTSRPVEGRLE